MPDSAYPLGRLKNGNPAAPIEVANTAPLCGARTRAGGRCRNKAMANGRCRLHGGLSTGPRTPEGKERARMANYRHGQRTREAIAERKRRAEALRRARRMLALVQKPQDQWDDDDFETLAEFMDGGW